MFVLVNISHPCRLRIDLLVVDELMRLDMIESSVESVVSILNKINVSIT